jgi:hypothetical protein
MLRLMVMNRLLLCLVLSVTACGSVGSSAGESAARTCAATPAASDQSGGGAQEQSVTFPEDGSRIEVTVRVGEHVTVGWSGCGEHGQIKTSPADNLGPISSSDISVYSSPRPTPSLTAGSYCCQRPEADGVFSIRYLAQMPGTQILHGTGSAGSDGEIAVTVTPLTTEQGRLVTGVIDTSRLRDHPSPDVVYFQPSGMNPTQTIAKPTTDGHFSTRLSPGKYTLMASSPAYNDGRAQCVRKQPVDVGQVDIKDIAIVCTER